MLLLSAITPSVATSVAYANLLTNGSFETPTVPVGGFTSFGVGSALITGWTVVGPAGKNVSIVSGSFTQGGVSFVAEDANQWMDLTGFNDNSTEGVTQTIATTAGHLYELSYFIGNTTGGGIFGTTSTVNVSINGVPTFSDTNSTVSPTTLAWQKFTHDVVASGTSLTVTLINGDPSTDNSNGLDNVVLLDLGPSTLPPTTEIPEPASLALLGAGLAGLGWVRRRK